MTTITWQNAKLSQQNKKKHSRSKPDEEDTNERRVKDFRADLLDLRTKFDSLKRLHSETLVSSNRNELFGRRGFHSATPENPYDAGRIRTNAGLTREEGMLRESDFLKRTEGQLEEYIGRGMAVLDNLVEQRGFLKVNYSRLRMRVTAGCAA